MAESAASAPTILFPRVAELYADLRMLPEISERNSEELRLDSEP